LKAQTARKVAGKAGKRKKDDDRGVVPASAEGQPQEPKLKKVKVKVHDEINIMAKKIEDKTQGAQNKYGNMVKSMSSTRAEAQPSGKPASKTPSQVQVTGGRRLKREGAIANIKEGDMPRFSLANRSLLNLQIYFGDRVRLLDGGFIQNGVLSAVLDPKVRLL